MKNLLNRPVICDADLVHYQQQSVMSTELMNTSEIYLKAVNQLIRQYSEGCSLCFLYLPPPPALPITTSLNSTSSPTMQHHLANNIVSPAPGKTESTPNNSFDNSKTNAALILTSQETTKYEMNARYMRILELQSESLPPCIYVNGVSCVTSTHL